MLINFFNSGVSSSVPLMKYLMGKDADGNERDPAPKVLFGDVQTTAAFIDMNNNKQKYTSGVISFRDSENPTQKEMMNILKDFYAKFAPGMTPDRINLLAVLHQDKGNKEIHIVIPRLDLKTMKSFNIAPPGPLHQRQVKDFSAIWNDKLGYQQVVENPLKVVLSKFDYYSDINNGRKAIKSKLGELLYKGVVNGKLNNRSDLVSAIERTGSEITRKGKDYISVKFKGQSKAIRFKGPAFSEDVNYQKLMKEPRPTVLNDEQRQVILNRLNSAVNARLSFNQSRYKDKPKRTYSAYPKVGTKAHQALASRIPAIGKSIAKTDSIKNPTNMKQNLSNTINGKLIEKIKGSQNATKPSFKESTGSGVNSIRISLGNLWSRINAATADVANAKTTEERIEAEKRLSELMAQEAKLQYQLSEAQKAELNRSNPRPP